MGKHWEVKLDMVNNCTKGPKKQKVLLGRLAKLKIDLLMKKFKKQEWLAYLLGEDYRVTDLFIPIQRASETFIGNVECEEYNRLKVIGVMHSHHNMQIDFSGHDHDFINSNHNISLLANMSNHNNSYQITGQVRVQVPCGALYVVPADVSLDLEVDGFDKDAFMDEVDKKVNPPKICTNTVCYCGKCNLGGHPGFNYGGCRSNHDQVPAHFKTFPGHSPDCSCTACVRDRKEYAKKLKQKKGWTTEPDLLAPLETPDYSYTTEGAWVCGECSKLNYESEGERLEECVWCNSPREEEEVGEEEKEINAIDALIDGIKEDLEEFNSLVTVDPDNKLKFQQRKYLDIEEDLAEEQILDRAIQKVSKYLFLIKRLDEGGYKLDLDHFVNMLSVEYAENEENLRDEIASIILELEDQLEEKNLEK